MQNFVGKTKCIVGYMKVADTIAIVPTPSQYHNIHVTCCNTIAIAKMSSAVTPSSCIVLDVHCSLTRNGSIILETESELEGKIA